MKRESEAALNRLLAEQLRANTLSAYHHNALRRLPSRKKKPDNWGKAILGIGLFVFGVGVFLIALI